MCVNFIVKLMEQKILIINVIKYKKIINKIIMMKFIEKMSFFGIDSQNSEILKFKNLNYLN